MASSSAVHEGSRRVAWFLRSQVSSSLKPVNYVDISVAVKNGDENVCAQVFGLDVPKDAFDRMLERAAKHPGYSARSSDVHETRTRDSVMTFEFRDGRPTKVRAARNCLVDASVLQGSSLLVRRYQKTHVQLPMFPHSVAPHSSYRARRALLRIHRYARLVFESRILDGLGMQQQRRVRIEVELLPNVAERDLLDLQRTVENTIQVVLLGGRALVGKSVPMVDQVSKQHA